MFFLWGLKFAADFTQRAAKCVKLTSSELICEVVDGDKNSLECTAASLEQVASLDSSKEAVAPKTPEDDLLCKSFF